MTNIIIDENGFDILDEATEIRVHVNSNLSGFAVMESEEMVTFQNVGDFIDSALLIKSALTDRYGGYK